MKKKFALIAAAGLLASPGIVQAQEFLTFSGTGTLGYSFGDVSSLPGGASLDANLWSIDIETDVGIGDRWNVGIDLGFADVDFGGTAGAGASADAFEFSLEPSYRAENGAFVGVYYQNYSLDSSGFAGILGFTQVDAESYGFFGGYEGNLLTLEGFIGTSGLNQFVPVSTDTDDVGVSASYLLGDRTELFGAVMHSNINVGGGGVSLTSWSAGAEYDFTDSLAVFGGVGYLDADLGGPVQNVGAVGYSIGVSYDLSSQLNVPVILSAEYSYTDIEATALLGTDPSVDRFAFGITVPLGGGSGNILNSNTRQARGDYRSVFEAIGNTF
ncbi:MAG: hypothetical protein AAF231_01895 [Pseudomonadota bacterium]